MLDAMAKTVSDTGRIALRLGDYALTLRLDADLIEAIEEARDGRSVSDTIRDVLERAFQAKGDGLYARIKSHAVRDRRDVVDVVRICLQDEFQKGVHGKPIYPVLKPRVKWI